MVVQPGTQPVYALLVEDDPFMRSAVADFLEEEMGMEVVQAATYQEAHRALATSRPTYQLALVDVSLPRVHVDEPRRASWGLQLIQDIKEINARCGVVLWSAYTHFLPKLMQLVAQGYQGLAYIPKGVRAQILHTAIQRVMEGDVYLHRSVVEQEQANLEEVLLSSLDPEVARLVVEVAKRFKELSPRQMEVTRRITRTPAAIADELGLEVRTVRNYQDAIYERLGLRAPFFQMQHIRRDPVIVLALLLHRLQQPDTS